MRPLVFLLLGLLVPALAGAQASHEEAAHAAPPRAGVPVRATGPKTVPAAPHEESRAEPTPPGRTVRTPTAREPEPARPVVRDVLKEDAAKLEAVKAAQAARAAKPAALPGRAVTKSNKQLADVAERLNARMDAVNATAPSPADKQPDVEAIVAQINRRLEREMAARSVKRQQARAKEAAAVGPPRVGLSWRVPVIWSELQSVEDAEIPRPTQLSWPVPSWTPAAEVARGSATGRAQGPSE